MAMGARVKQVRQERGLTQAELAERVGVGQSSIASLENRDNKKTDHDVEIAQALGVSADWLRTGQPPKYQAPAQPSPAPGSTPPRLRTIIDNLFSLSEKSLQYLEPLVDDLARLESIERAQRGTKKE